MGTPPVSGAKTGSVPEARDFSDHAVVLMFDDGWHSVFTYAYPLLKDHDMTANLAIISGTVGSGRVRYGGDPKGYLNRAEIQEMIDSLDIEVSSHSRTHPFLTRLANDSIREELTDSKHTLEKMFHQDVALFVYPYGDYDRRVRNLVREAGYRFARSIRPGNLDFIARPYDLPATEVRLGASVDRVKHQVQNRPALILFFHRILPRPTTYTEWSVDKFAEFLDWLDAQHVQVVTVAELYELQRGRLPLPMLARQGWRYRVEWELLEQVNANVTRVAERR
jgi:peptidoglycan/xylan/chitin deacetylase (PgdA/CDA1 family)